MLVLQNNENLAKFVKYELLNLILQKRTLLEEKVGSKFQLKLCTDGSPHPWAHWLSECFYESNGKLNDKRNDFSNATVRLRKTVGFVLWRMRRHTLLLERLEKLLLLFQHQLRLVKTLVLRFQHQIWLVKTLVLQFQHQLWLDKALVNSPFPPHFSYGFEFGTHVSPHKKKAYPPCQVVLSSFI